MSEPRDMILTRPFKWRGKMLKKGSKVSASISERYRLIRLGWAADYVAPVGGEEPKVKRAYKRRDIAKAPERVVLTPEPPHVLPPPEEELNPLAWMWPTKPKSEDDGQE